jgi:hypothetical protein
MWSRRYRLEESVVDKSSIWGEYLAHSLIYLFPIHPWVYGCLLVLVSEFLGLFGFWRPWRSWLPFWGERHVFRYKSIFVTLELSRVEVLVLGF